MTDLSRVRERTNTPAQDRSLVATRSGTVHGVIADLARRPGYQATFVLIAVAVALGYSVLLPFQFTQRFTFTNWRYLTPRLTLFSIALGLGMAGLITVQVYAIRRITRARGTSVGGLAALASVAPSLLCCTPIIPTVLASLGLSTVTVYGTTGTLQRFFAVHETAFLTGSLILLLVTGWWSARRVARSACITDSCSTTPAQQHAE